MSDVVLVCLEHGDVFVHRGAGWGTVRDWRALEPVLPDVSKPAASDAIRCPLCGRWLSEEVRDG